jgi:extracellular elastinolytic metalloproteinase
MATRKSSSKKRPSAKKASAKKTTRKAPAKRKTATRNQAADAPPSAPPARLGNQGVMAGVPANFHALYDRGFRASRGIAPAAAAPKTTTGHRRLARSVTGLDVHYDSATQLPKLVITQRPAARLTRRAAGTAESAVMDFVRSRSDLWNLSGGDTATIEVTSVSEPRGEASADVPAAPPPGRRRGAARAAAAPADDSTFNVRNLQTVNLIQRIDGKEVFNSDVSAAVDRNNQVIAVSGQFFPGASSQPARRRAAAASAAAAPEEEAIARAVFDLTGVAYAAGDFARAAADSGPYRIYEYKPAANDPRPMLERPVRLKDVMFPLGEGQFVPAYYMEIWIRGFPAFAYVFDAVDTPDLLYRKNLTAHIAFSYRVHNTGDAVMRPHDGPAPGTPHPKGTPNGFQAKPVKEKLIKVDSLLPGDSWLPSDAKTTDGNNCIAYADLGFPDGLNSGDVLGKVTSARKFDYTYNHKKKASDPKNLQNSLVGMFFHVNWLHDRWYEAGFDEASGNAQKDNFGRGGVDGDPILAEGNDFEGTDNANMSTPADGASPRMQMYEFTGTSPITRTSNHEALITFHEMGHYITNRLVGNANGLFNTQGGAMGEGWGDFFAICMTSQANDDFAKGVFAAGGWTDLTADFKENYYFSIRRYPYSADMTKNPLTFKHIGNNVVLPTGPPTQASPAGNNEIHNAGEVWCSILWEVFVNLVAKHGHAEAEKRMLAYVIGGLKLTPPDPTFVNARDGIISAVSAISPTDLPEVKAGFAKRGIGSGAVAPPSDSDSLAGVVESFVP